MTDHSTSYFEELHNSVSPGLRKFGEWISTLRPDEFSPQAARSKLYELAPRLDEFRAVMAERMETRSNCQPD